MFHFNIPHKQYILSLDSLDLSFLSQYVEKSNDEKRPLFSNRVDKETAYYKVELLSEETQDNDPFIEPYKNYFCYICNTDVPVQFYKQHNKSKIHQNYKKLAENFLENVTKQMNVDLDNISNNLENDTFYCETCCKVVAVKHKRKHRSSNLHLKYMEHEKLTSKFLEMYINKDKLENRNKYENYDEDSYKDSASNSSDSVQNIDWHKVYDDSEGTNKQNNKICHSVHTNYSVDKPRTEMAIDTSLSFNLPNDNKAFQLNLEEVIKSNKLQCTLHTVEHSSIIIVVPKENKDKIPPDSSPDQKLERQNIKVRERPTYKSVTSERVDEDEKIPGEKICHNQPSSSLIGYENGSNYADFSLSHQTYQHSNASTHENVRHVDRFKDSDNESFGDENISEEELSSATSDYSDTSLPYKNTNVGTENKKIIEYMKQFSERNATQVYCLVCSVIVPRYERNIIEHVEGFTHKRILLRNHYLEQRSNLDYYCYLCNVCTVDFVGHINKNITHKSKYDIKLICKSLLREFVYDDPNNKNLIPIHCREQYKNELRRNKIVSTEPSSFYCEICRISLSRVSEIDHMFGERHRNALKIC